MNGIGIFVSILFLFFVGSVSGWCVELLFRRFISTANPERRWINPGFLAGPCLPLYGSGLVVLYLFSDIPLPVANSNTKGIILILLMAVMMTLIEYITGIFFLKVLHVRLWDYTERWGNIQGVICPLFSLIWAVVGALYYYLVHPHVLNALSWLTAHMSFCLAIGFFYGVFAVDIEYSFKIVARIKKFAVENDIVIRYETLKSNIRAAAEERKEKMHFLLAFRSEVPFREHLERYLDLMTAFYEDKLPKRPGTANAGKNNK